MQTKDTIPKILHLYWDGSAMSFLQMLTVATFNHYNDGWEIYLWMPANRTITKTWESNENKDKYTGLDYFKYLMKFKNLTIKHVNFSEIGFFDDASEVFKSDYLRYWALYTHGGIYADFDIIFVKPVFDCLKHINSNNALDAVTIIYEYELHPVFPIGFLMANKGSRFFKQILENVLKYFDRNKYQSIGAVMFAGLFKSQTSLANGHPDVILLDRASYLPYMWNEVGEIFDSNVDKIRDNTVGIHWFNGASYCKVIQNKLGDIRLVNKLPDAIIYKYIDLFFTQFKNEPNSEKMNNT